MKQLHARWKSFRREESGVFTLEASMLFPTILIITMCLIFFSLVVYQKAVLQFQANRLADQIAYNWNNSQRDLETGEFDLYTSQRGGDGLYWRLTGNDFMSKFGLPGLGDGLAGEKTDQSLLSHINAEGSITHNNSLAGNYITVDLEQPVRLPSAVLEVLGIQGVGAKATRMTSEPTEFIRNTDFVVYFAKKVNERVSGYINKFKDKKK